MPFSNTSRRGFELETLEPRLLLSANPVALLAVPDSGVNDSASTPIPTDHVLTSDATFQPISTELPRESSATPASIFELGTFNEVLDLGPSGEGVTGPQPTGKTDATQPAPQAENHSEVGLTQIPELLAPITDSADHGAADVRADSTTAGVDVSNDPISQLVETLKVANAPPQSSVETQLVAASNTSTLNAAGGTSIHLVPGQPLDISGGLLVGVNDSLSGNGSVFGATMVAGLLSPGNSPGTITFNGDTILEGVTKIELGASANDQVIMQSGKLTFGGTLQISLYNGFVPTIGQRFEIFTLSADGADGSFATLEGTSFQSGSDTLYLIPIKTPGKVVLVASSHPSSDIIYEANTEAAGTALANFWGTDQSASTVVTFSGQLDIPGVASVGGTFGLQFSGNQSDPIQIAATGVNVSVKAGSFSASLTGGSLGLLINPNATFALQATGAFALAGGGFANVQADSASLFFNNTGFDVVRSFTVGLATVSMAAPNGSTGLAVTGLSADFNGKVHLAGDFGFAQQGLDATAAAAHATASLTAGGTTISLTDGNLGWAYFGRSNQLVLEAEGGLSVSGSAIANVEATNVRVQFNTTGNSFAGVEIGVGAVTHVFSDTMTATLHAGFNVTGFKGQISGLSVEGDFGFTQDGTTVEATAGNLTAGISTVGGNVTVGVSDGSLALRLGSDGLALAATGAPSLNLGANFLNVAASAVTITLNTGQTAFTATLTTGGTSRSVTVDSGTLLVSVVGFKATVGGALSVEGDFGFTLNGSGLGASAGNVTASIATASGNVSVGVSDGSLAFRLGADGLALAATGAPSLNLGTNFLSVAAAAVTITLNTGQTAFMATLTTGGNSRTVTVDAGSLMVTVEGFKAQVKTFVDLEGDLGFALNGGGLDVVGQNVSALLKAGKASAGITGGHLAMRLNSDGTLALRAGGAPFLDLGSKVGNVSAEQVEVAFNSSSVDYGTTTLTVGALTADLTVAGATGGVPVVVLEVTGLRANLGTSFTMLGTFGAKKAPSDGGLEFAGAISSLDLKLGSKRLVKLGGSAAFRSNNDGIAADFLLTVFEGPTIPNLAFGGTFHVRLNTTGLDVDAIKGRTVSLAAETPFELHLNGQIVVKGQALEGAFDLQVNTEDVQIAAVVNNLELLAGSTRILQLHGSGAMLINKDGVAAQFSLVLDHGPALADFEVSGSFTLALNTTGVSVDEIQNVGVNLPALSVLDRYVKVEVAGRLTIKSQVFDGKFAFSRNEAEVAVVAVVNQFELYAGTKRLFALHGRGTMLVTATGVATQFDLALDQGPAIGDLEVGGSFSLAINTTGTDISTILDETVDLPGATTGAYVRVEVGGYLRVKGQEFAGSFKFSHSDEGVAVVAKVTKLELKAGAKRLFSLKGTGVLLVTETGVATEMSLDLDLSAGSEINNFSITGSFSVAVNTTGHAISEILGETVHLPPPLGGPYVRFFVSGDIQVSGQHIAGGFGFEKNGNEVGVVLEVTSFEVRSGTRLLVSLAGSAAMLFAEDGFAGQFTLSVLSFPAINKLDLSGSVTFYINTTGRTINEIASKGVQLAVSTPGEIIVRVKIASFAVKFGEYLTLGANDVTFNLMATGHERLVTFGGDPDTEGSGALEVSFGSQASVFAGWGGRAGNFAIGADLSFQLLDEFYVSISIGGSSGSKFGLPSWLPIKVNKVGIKFNQGAVDNLGNLVDPGNFNIIFSGGIDGNVAWVEAQVSNLEVNVQKLVNGEFPIVNIGGLSLGIKNLKIGPATVTGLITFGVLTVDGDLNTPGKQEVSAFYGRVAGKFFYSGIGGGIDLALSTYGPLVANFSIGGLTEPNTGFVFGFEDVGINFGGGPWRSVSTPEEILTVPELQHPVAIDTEMLISRVEKALKDKQLTWDSGFTIGGTATVTNLYVQGLIQGTVTLAANIGIGGQDAGLKILALGNLNVFGMPFASAGMLFDFSNVLRPLLNMTVALPSPSNPFGFLFPATGTLSLTLDSKGVLEMPIVGLSVFASEVATDLLTNPDGLYSHVMNSIASHLQSERGNPLSQLLLDLDGNLTIQATEEAQTITSRFILQRLSGLNPNVPSLLVSSFAALNPVNGVDPLAVSRGVNAVGLFVPEFINAVRDLSPADYVAAVQAFAKSVQDSAIDGLAAGWDRLDPSLTITGKLQSTIFGIPIGDPLAEGSIVITKNAATAHFSGHLTQLILSQVDGPLAPLFLVIPPGLQAISDTTVFDATNEMPGVVVTALIKDLSTNGPDAVSLSRVLLDSINPFKGWEVYFASTMTSFGFKLGTVSGIMFGPQVGAHGEDHSTPSFTSRVVNLDPDGDGHPNADLILQTNASVNLIPVATKVKYDHMRQYGGIVMTGQLFMPNLLIDPVQTIKDIDWTPPVIDFNVTDPLAIVDQVTKVQEYVERIYAGLTKQTEWAKIQIYIASPARLFQLDNYLDPTPGRADTFVPVDFASLSSTLQQELMNIVSAGFVEGYAKLRMFGTDFGTAHLQGTYTGFSAEMEIPWLAGLRVKIETGYQHENVAKLIRDLASSPLATVVGITPAQLDLLNDPRVAIDLDVPVASFEGNLSTATVANWLVQQFGLPAAVFTPVSSGQQGFDAFLGIYSPGFGGEGTTGIKRTGGLKLDAHLNITGIVDHAAFSFEIQPFSFYENTDLATFLIPNFHAHAEVPSLTIPGLAGRADLVSLTGFVLDLNKNATGIHFFIAGSLELLGNPAFNVAGQMEFNSSGLYGDILVTLGGGAGLHFNGNGLEFSGTGHLRVNTSNTEQLGIAAHTGLVYLGGNLRLVLQGVEAMYLGGFFELSVGSGALRVAANATIRIGAFDGFQASGVLNLDNAGIYGSVDVVARVVNGPGFSFDGALHAEINTTFSTRLGIHPLSAKLIVAGNLHLYAGGREFYSLGGTFRFGVDTSGLVVSIEAQISAGLLGNFAVSGTLGISTGGIWGALQLGLQTMGGPGYSLSGNLQVEVNTTSSYQSVIGFVVSPLHGDIMPGQTITLAPFSLRMLGGGHLRFAGGLQVSGAFSIAGTGSQLDLFLNGTIDVFGVTLTVYGGAAFYANDGSGAGGIFLSLQLGFAGAPRFSAGGLSLTGTVYLLVNSSPVSRNGVAGNTYAVNIDNAAVSFLGFTATGSFTMTLSGGVFTVTIPWYNPLRMSFLGANLELSGYFNSVGGFSFTASFSASYSSTIAIPNLFDYDAAAVRFRDTAYFSAGVSLSGSVTFSNGGFSASLSASAYAGAHIRHWEYNAAGVYWYEAWWDFSIGASGSGSISLVNGVFSASLHARLNGSGLPWPLSEFVKVLPAFDFNVTLGSQAPTRVAAAVSSFAVPSFGEVNRPVTVSGSGWAPADPSQSVWARWYTPAGVGGWSYVPPHTSVASTFSVGTPGEYPVTLELQAWDPSIGGWRSTFQAGVVVVTLPAIVVQVTPPTAVPGGAYVAQEGTPLVLDASGSISDQALIGYEWDLNYDGVNFDADIIGGPRVAISFPDNFGTRTIALRVTDRNGLQDIATTTLTVLNVAPQPAVTNISPNRVEGATVTVTGSANDPGSLDLLTYFWQVYKDSDTIAYSSASGVGLTNFVFTPADDGLYRVVLEVRDDDGGSGVVESSVDVQNLAPTLSSVGVSGLRLEGNTITSAAYATDPAGSNDPLIYFWSVSKGDSPAEFASDSGTDLHSFSFVPDDNGIYQVRVLISDGDGGFTSWIENITVENVAPVANAGPNLNVTEGASLTLAAMFNDKGTFDTHTATINWGDGTLTEIGTVTESPFGPPGATTGANGDVTGNHIYADNGIYTVTVTVVDKDGAISVSTLKVTVANVVPTLVVPGNQVVNEGTRLVLPGLARFTDPGFDNAANPGGATVEAFSFEVNWGDGSAVEYGVAPVTLPGHRGLATAGGFGGNHVYADNGAYTVSVKVTDDDGGVAIQTLVVTVLNVTPTLVAGADQTANEGSLVTLDPSRFNDKGTLDTHSATINWGDGTATELGVVREAPFGPPGSTDGANGSVAGQHVYADNGLYTVTVVVTDDDGASVTSTLKVTVLNVTPTLVAGVNQTANEGSVVTLDPSRFNDKGTLDTHSATINWGDGTVTELGVVREAPFGPPGSTDGANGSVAGQHVYADNGIYTVTVVVTDDDGASVTSTLKVTVLNVTPTLVAGVNQTANEGAVVTLDPSRFNDKGTLDTHSATINWGDGTVTELGVVTESPFGPPGLTSGANGTVAGQHVYADNGIYTVTVVVTDDDGASVTSTLKVTVLNVAPTLVAGVDQTANEGAWVRLDPSRFNDKGTLDTHTATINWGDGNVTEISLVTESPFGPPGSTNGANGTIAGQHVYADNGIYTVTVVVTDDDGGSATSTLKVTVLNVVPTLQVAGSNLNVDANGVPVAFSGVRGQNLTVQGAFTDPGFDNALNAPGQTVERFTYRVSWGDATADATGNGAITTPGRPDVATAGNFGGDHIYTREGTYNLVVTITDDDGGATVVRQTVTVKVASLQVDPVDSTKVVLAVGGTVCADGMQVSRTDGSTTPSAGSARVVLSVSIDSVALGGSFAASFTGAIGRLLVFGQSGDDDVKVNGVIDSLQFGEAGNDRLQGGQGNNVLVGGDGDDQLFSGKGRDILIGGWGADRLVGASNDDILISGWTDFDRNATALGRLQSEWSSGRDSATRVNNLSGLGSAVRLNLNFFLTADSTDGGRSIRGTVHDDRSEDKLTGSSGINWLFYNLDGETGSIKDTYSGNTKNSFVVDLDYLAAP